MNNKYTAKMFVEDIQFIYLSDFFSLLLAQLYYTLINVNKKKLTKIKIKNLINRGIICGHRVYICIFKIHYYNFWPATNSQI